MQDITLTEDRVLSNLEPETPSLFMESNELERYGSTFLQDMDLENLADFEIPDFSSATSNFQVPTQVNSESHGKVHTLKESQPESRLDCSLDNLYSLPELLSHKLSASTCLGLSIFLQRLKEATCHSSPEDALGQQSPQTHPDIENYETLNLQCHACVDRYPMSRFLSPSHIHSIIENSLQPSPDILASAGAQALSALGYYLMHSDNPSKPTSTTQHRLRAPISEFRQICEEPASLLKLQVLLLHITVSSIVTHASTGDIILAAVQCARHLSSRRSLQQHASASELERKSIERAVRYLYCVEADVALAQGILPILDLDWIIYPNEAPICEDNSLDQECSLFSFMHSITRGQYSPAAIQAARRGSVADLENRFRSISRRLKGLPSCPSATSLTERFTDEERNSSIRAFYLHHKAMLLTSCPWIAVLEDKLCDAEGQEIGLVLATSEMQLHWIETSLQSAVAVIQATYHLWSSGTVRNAMDPTQDLNQLLPISLCMLLFQVSSGDGEARKKALPYLGLFGAVLGQLALNGDDPDLVSDYFELITSDGIAAA